MNIDPKQKYQSLVRVLQWNDGFGLFFVTCSFAQTDDLFNKLLSESELSEKKIKLLSFENEIVTNIYAVIKDLLTQEHFNIVIIRGLEYSLYEYEEEKFSNDSQERYLYSWKGVPRFLGNLNMHRDSFRDNFPISYIFCVPQFALTYFIRRAQDFFDWRSGIFRLESYLHPQIKYSNLQDTDLQVLKSAKFSIQKDLKEFYDQSLQFFLDHKYESSAIAIDKILAIQSNSFESLYLKAKILEKLDRHQEALLCYDQILSLNVDNSWKWDKCFEILSREKDLMKEFEIRYQSQIDFDDLLKNLHLKEGQKYIFLQKNKIKNFRKFLHYYYYFNQKIMNISQTRKKPLTQQQNSTLPQTSKNSQDHKILTLNDLDNPENLTLTEPITEEPELIKLYLKGLSYKEIQKHLSEQGKSYSLSTISKTINIILKTLKDKFNHSIN